MLNTIKNELQRISKHKVILLVAVVVPIVITLMLGYEFGEGVILRVPTVVCDLDQSALSRSIVGYFADNDVFDISGYVAEQSRIEPHIRDGRAVVGIIIPKNFAADAARLKLPAVLMVYDGSRMAAVSAAKSKAAEILFTLKAGVALRQMEAHANLSGGEALHAVMPITVSRRNLHNPSGNFSYFLLPGLVLAIAQTGLVMACAGCIRWFEERKKYRSVIEYAAGKIVFYSIIGFLVICVSLLFLVYIFKLPFAGSPAHAIALGAGLSFSVAALGCAASALGELIKRPYFSIVLSGILIIPDAIMAGYTWPLIAMPELYRETAYFIPFYHAADNMRHLFFGGTLRDFPGDMLFLILFGLGAALVCIGLIGLGSRFLKGGGPDASELAEGGD